MRAVIEDGRKPREGMMRSNGTSRSNFAVLVARLGERVTSGSHWPMAG